MSNFEKIGNQTGVDKSETPAPVGRAGSLPGQAQAGSPNVLSGGESASGNAPTPTKGAFSSPSPPASVAEIVERACVECANQANTSIDADVDIHPNDFKEAVTRACEEVSEIWRERFRKWGEIQMRESRQKLKELRQQIRPLRQAEADTKRLVDTANELLRVLK